MTFLKKINDRWNPQEKPGLQVGEVVDFPGPCETLVRGGMALLVDKDGNEVELPGQTFECPVCFRKIEGLKSFIDHVSGHMPKPKIKTEETKTDVAAEEKKKDIRAKRLAALEKARAARIAKLKKPDLKHGKEK